MNAFGGQAALSVLDLPEPEPDPGKARIRETLAGVNLIDVTCLPPVGTYRSPS